MCLFQCTMYIPSLALFLSSFTMRASMSNWTFRNRWMSWWSLPRNFLSSLSIWISLNTRPWLESALKRAIWRKSRSLRMRGVKSMKRNEQTRHPLQHGQRRANGKMQNQQFSERFCLGRTSRGCGKTWLFVGRQDWKTNVAISMCPSSFAWRIAHQARPISIKPMANPIRI